ncbi:MAG: hypothetical protein QM731_04865 [Chitinophagaceae bacterium]
MNPYAALCRQLLALLLCLVACLTSISQSASLTDGRKTGNCAACQGLIQNMPKEVLFGIHISAAGDIEFSMNDKTWFDKLFTGEKDGISADLVAKDQYVCGQLQPGKKGLPEGYMLQPVYLPALKKKMDQQWLNQGYVSIKIGTVPASLKGKEIEGNLVIVKNGQICYYTYFTNVERSLWDLLPMGLFADSLLNTENFTDSAADILHYSKKINCVVPFAKNKATYNAADIKPLYDSLKLTNYSIKKIVIRAYSSVEGPENINNQLQQQRAASIVKALQQYQSLQISPSITSNENWVEFYSDVRQTPYAKFASLNRQDVKKALTVKTALDSLEPVLKKHRKAVITIYLDNRSGFESTPSNSLASSFKQAIIQKNIRQARAIQREVYERVADNKLAAGYLNQLEIPREKAFIDLLIDHESYKYQLLLSPEDEALANFQALLKIDPDNGKLRYNICALNFSGWRHDTAYVRARGFWQDINELEKYGIGASLVRRMQVNYHIIASEHAMSRFDYNAKDESIRFIATNYMDLDLDDKSLLSLSKYLCYYAHCSFAAQILSTRAAAIDVDEELLFYYISLNLGNPIEFNKPAFGNILQNAITLNQKRFCSFFNSLNNGGVSFQLLEYDTWMKVHCEHCRNFKTL